MKRHYRNCGVCNSARLHTEQDAVFQFLDNGEAFFLHLDRWQLVYLAKQIRDLLEVDLQRAQERRAIYK